MKTPKQPIEIIGSRFARKALLALLLCALGACEAKSPTATPPTAKAAFAAKAFLSTLSDAQRHSVVFAYDDAAQRARWSNFPTGFVPREGMRLKDMTPAQRDAVMRLLSAVLSPKGMEKVERIREADDAFKEVAAKHGPPGPRDGPPRGPGEGPPGGAGRPQGPPGDHPPFDPDTMFGSDLYYISFLGEPSTSAPWMLQFGGHHLALNITISGDKGVLTPSLTGAQPATFQRDGQSIRPLGAESDKGFALLSSLDEEQRKRAVLTYRVGDLVLGPGQDGKKILPEGLKVSEMTDAQRARVLDLIGEWAGILDDADAATRMAEMKADLGETWFAWSGPTSVEPGKNITAYYRIQGPHLVIEYAPQRGEPEDHVHTMVRDPTNDYGLGAQR